MARPEAYNREDVLNKAMQHFWRHGYEATSVQDLVDVTGINRSTLYNSFGSKRDFFMSAVAHYRQQESDKRLNILRNTPAGKRAIEHYFQDLRDFAISDERQLGCLLTNAAVELAPHDTRIQDSLRGGFLKVEDALCDAIKRGQDSGDIPAEKNPRALARFLLNTIQGVRVLSRSNADPATIKDAISVALQALE